MNDSNETCRFCGYSRILARSGYYHILCDVSKYFNYKRRFWWCKLFGIKLADDELKCHFFRKCKIGTGNLAKDIVEIREERVKKLKGE